jgi:hypothetical protein
VDWNVYPDTPVARLPRLLRPPALLLRNILGFLRLMPRTTVPEGPAGPDYVYEADGLATVYFTPFLGDREWTRAYGEMAEEWYPDVPNFDIRWRMWILTSVARQVRGLPGDISEFGVYRAGCARMVLGTVGLEEGTRYHLFDTFGGIPDSQLTERERREGYEGRLSDTSVDYVRSRLADWSEALVFHAGDVFETIPAAGIEELSLVHMDLNASAPTKVALEFTYPRLVPGGVIVFDDYGWNAVSYEQRDVIDEFCRPLAENVIALPSGQALLVKLP